MAPLYRAAVIGLGRMGHTYDDERVAGGPIYLPYCHTPSYQPRSMRNDSLFTFANQRCNPRTP